MCEEKNEYEAKTINSLSKVIVLNKLNDNIIQKYVARQNWVKTQKMNFSGKEKNTLDFKILTALLEEREIS